MKALHARTRSVRSPGAEPRARAPLSSLVRRASGPNPFLCYQCVKCSSGCPLADEMDLLPHQVMRAIQLGQDRRVLASDTIWLCASCQTCSTRCPQGVNVAEIMDLLRIEARRRNVRPAVPEVARFNKLFLANVRLLGRLYEIGLMAGMNLVTGDLTRDLDLGVQMVNRRKIRLLPTVTRPPRRVRRVEPAPNRIAYYPGCSLRSSAGEYDHSARAVARALDIDLVEPPGWVCCGSTPAHATDPALAFRLPVRNLGIVEQMGLDTVTAPCSACFSRFKTAQATLKRRPDMAGFAAGRTGYRYRGTVNVLSLLDLLFDRVGPERIAARVTHPLTIADAARLTFAGEPPVLPRQSIPARRPLKVACYYGCLLTRPPGITGAERHEYPVKMDRLVAALGAQPLDWSHKTECCGASLGITRTSLALKLTSRILRDAHDCGADVVVTVCPLCHVNLDARQARAGLDFRMPVLYLTQLMALAFGLDREAELNKNITDPRPLVERVIPCAF